MVSNEILTVVIANLAAILTAVGTCATALAGAYLAVKQAKTHTAITELKATYDANHPQSPVQ